MRNSRKIKKRGFMNPLDEIATPYVTAETLMRIFQDYSKPREKIRRMVDAGNLIRLKNGFYLIKGRDIPYEQVANLLYGPSYISLEWALSFYGIIPERAYVVTSITNCRFKEYETPVGRFSYEPLNSLAYSIGIHLKKSASSMGNFLMATPEKALVDLVFHRCKNLSKEELKIDLLESRRIDKSAIASLDKKLLCQIGERFAAKRVHYFIDLVCSWI